MRAVITGGAGFIGSNLADALQQGGSDVAIIDDFSTGAEAFLAGFSGDVHRMDITDDNQDLRPVLVGADVVYHLAANADVRFGWNDTRRDLTQNVLATIRVAEAAADAGVRDVVFSSTGSVYGEATQIPTPEDARFPDQTSLYGASKAAAEGFLSAFASNDTLNITVLRFVSVLGPRYTHGHVLDFVRQLTEHADHLRVLGNGRQRKSYMHIDDCVRGLISLRAPRATDQGPAAFGVFNLGVDEYCTVRDSIGWITQRMGVAPRLEFGDSDRGWVGDNPFIWLDVTKAREHGWVAASPIRASVESTVDWILANDWVLSTTDHRAV